MSTHSQCSTNSANGCTGDDHDFGRGTRLGGISLRISQQSAAIAWIAALLAAAAPARGAIIPFVADPMVFANEVPCGGAGVPGIGYAAFNLDTVTGMVKFYCVYSGLGSPETAAHVHGPAAACANAGVLHGLTPPQPATSPKFGTYGPVNQAQMNAQLHYINVHTQAKPTGHIRGQIVPPPGLTGACCLENGTFCITTTQDLCVVQFGGIYQGDDTACSQPQACCLDQGGCIQVDPLCCDDLGGQPAGAGTSCATFNCGNRACCFPDGSCQQLDMMVCQSLGGRPQAPGSNCATTDCYKNWVIADDFMFGEECPDCPPDCDYNTDGICNQNDLDDVFDCVVNGVGTCDFTCDGFSDFLDYFVFDCTLNGGTDCCNFGVSPVNFIRWYGSYLDSDFEPGSPNQFRYVDGWSIAFHRDVPPQPCPPPPAGTQPIDLCGTIVNLAACGAIPGFRPDGTTNVYHLLGGPLPPIGAHVRICGFIDPACTPCPAMIACITVMNALPCDTGISRPSDLAAQWIFPANGVSEQDTGLIGCDGHRIFEYTTFMHQGCLVHNYGEPGEFTYYEFRPRQGRTYWMSIQSEVGHGVDLQYPPPEFLQVCTYTDNGNQANRDFWGWHTTPPGYHQKDDAYMGMLGMGCNMEWLYNWNNHLHWSQTPYNQCADDPTKSMDMAFSLSNYNKGGENVLWVQQVWPGPPIVPPPTFPQPPQFPPGGVDTFPMTRLTLTVEMNNPPLGIQNVTLLGSSVVARKNPVVMGVNDVIDTEIIAMQLTGFNPILGGNVNVSEPPGPTLLSPGRIQGPTGIPFPADSFFDVFYRVDLPGLGLSMRTQAPVNMPLQPPMSMWEVPPGQAIYQNSNIILLVDFANPAIIRGRVLVAVLDTGAYRGGLDIHSDFDWAFTPMQGGCICRGDMTGDARVDGDDIQKFVNCYIGCAIPPCPVVGCTCLCADLSLDGQIDPADRLLFISKLLTDPNVSCP